MKSLKNKKFSYWLRVIHRDLGFLMVGLCLVYGISGFLLNHMNGKDPAFKTVEETLHVNPGLDHDALKMEWNSRPHLPVLRRVIPVDEDHVRLMLEGGIGVYNLTTGVIDYEKHTRNDFIYWINKLHYNRVQGWSFMGDLFAFSLAFFAISGLFMVKGKKGLKGIGKWYLLAGLLIPVVYLLIA